MLWSAHGSSRAINTKAVARSSRTLANKASSCSNLLKPLAVIINSSSLLACCGLLDACLHCSKLQTGQVVTIASLRASTQSYATLRCKTSTYLSKICSLRCIHCGQQQASQLTLDKSFGVPRAIKGFEHPPRRAPVSFPWALQAARTRDCEGARQDSADIRIAIAPQTSPQLKESLQSCIC